MAGEGLFVAALKIAAAVAIGLPLVLYLAQDSLIFYRQPLAEARSAQIARAFPAAQAFALAASDGSQLRGWLVRPHDTGPVPLVLYFGGNAEEVSWMLEAVGDPVRGETPGVAWLLVNYRGYGMSEGAPSESALAGDALALYDHARRLPGIDAGSLFAFGRSLGSGVAVALAAERALRGVVLVNPYDSLVAVARHYYPYLPVSWMLKHRFDSIGRAPALRAPLLCVIAERDEVIPPQHGERLFGAWAGPKRKLLLAGAGHNDGDTAPQFWPEVRAFLAAGVQ
ncbi:MAG: alpha/beta hydrolase [Betaproteobacteria bacterium]|nr:MAG: alpha/beta hydrolase [Betaproteobacteria bacterium]